jgi:hypothetical protein
MATNGTGQQAEPRAMTLLAALTIWTEVEVVNALRSGALLLTGNFRGREAEVAAEWAEAA